MIPQSARYYFIIGCMILATLASLGSSAHGQAAPRQFAPGVETTIPVDLVTAETVSTHDLIEVRADRDLQWKPEYFSESRTLYGMSADVKFRREVSCLEFTFKPMRMIEVDGKMVWYLVYRVKNTGRTLKPVEQPDGTYQVEPGPGEPLQFLPHFVLEAQDRGDSGRRLFKAYLDSALPAAAKKIHQREAPRRQLFSSAQMAQQRIPVSDARTDRSVWGVATWEGVDPRMDFFSIYVGGLSNAYRWEDPPGEYEVGDPPGKGRRFVRKTLQLNFWRPGDEYLEHESEIRYGVPVGKARLYDVGEGVAYRWIYR